MARRLSLPLVGLLLLGVGVFFAWWGLHALTLERDKVNAEHREQARSALDEAVANARIRADAPLRPPEDRWTVLDSSEASLPEGPVTLFLREADHLDRVQGKAMPAVGLLTRVAHDEDAGPWRAIAALHAAAILIREGQDAEARPLLEIAAVPVGSLFEEDGLDVGLAARYHLARIDPAAREGRGLEAFLDGVEGGGLLSSRDRTGPDDLVLALAGDLPDEVESTEAGASLRRAAARVRRGLGLLAHLPEDGAYASATEVARRQGAALEVRDARSLLDGLRGPVWPHIRSVGSPTRGEGYVAPLPPPLDELEIIVRPRRAYRSVGMFLALAGALVVYLLGCALGLLAIRRSQRVAAMQSDFVAAVSHELKTPIASVRAMAEFLADGSTDDEAKVRDYARRIEGEMGRLGATVRNVLDAARIERQGSLAVVLAPDDPAEVVRLTCDAFAPTLEARGFDLHVDVRPSPKPVPLDRAALQGVVMNLVDNAAKFSGETKAIDVSAGPEGAVYRIEVKDRGRGLSPGHGDRLFRRFERDAAVKRDAVPGVGLGLYVVKETVEAHGGTVAARRRNGGGSVFTVEIPLEARSA